MLSFPVNSAVPPPNAGIVRFRGVCFLSPNVGFIRTLQHRLGVPQFSSVLTLPGVSFSVPGLRAPSHKPGPTHGPQSQTGCPGPPHFCPANYKFRGFHTSPHKPLVIHWDSQNSGERCVCCYELILKDAVQKPPSGGGAWGPGVWAVRAEAGNWTRIWPPSTSGHIALDEESLLWGRE